MEEMSIITMTDNTNTVSLIGFDNHVHINYENNSTTLDTKNIDATKRQLKIAETFLLSHGFHKVNTTIKQYA